MIRTPKHSRQRYSPWTRTVWIVLGCSFALTGTALGDRRIAPKFDPSAEEILLGASVWPEHSVERGTWRSTRHGLRPPKKRGAYFGFGEIQDGHIRVRFDKGRLKTQVFFRAQVSADGERIGSGYSVRIEGNRAWIEEWSKGRRKRISKKTKLWRFKKAQRIELSMTLVSERLAIQIYDRADEERLGFLYFDRLKVSAGLIGFSVLKGDRPPSLIRQVSYRPACRAWPDQEPGHFSVYSVDDDLGDTTFLDAHGMILERTNVGLGCQTHAGKVCPLKTVVSVDPMALTQLLCDVDAPITPMRRPPWKYRDGEFFRASQLERAPEDADELRYQLYSPEQVSQMLKAWHARFPKETYLLEIGRSVQGRPIEALAITDNAGRLNGKPHLLFNSAHHGNEPITVLMALDIIHQLLLSEREDDRAQMSNFVTWVVPVVNPDGLQRYLDETSGHGRKNGRPTHWPDVHRASGVDLNRNYPVRWGKTRRGSSKDISSPYYRGPQAGSEPETQAMMQLAKQYPFVGSISYHGGTVAILSPYTIQSLKNPKKDEAWAISKELLSMVPKTIHNRSVKVKRNLYPVDGVDQDWHRYRYGTLALLLEVARNTPLHWPDRKKLVEAWRPAWRYLAQRFLQGPSVTVRIVDADGRPVKRPVVIDGMQPKNGEKWTSRCPDGTYHRYVPSPGLYTVRVRDGRRRIKRRVRIRNENRTVTIKLKRRVTKHCEYRP